MDHRNQLDNIKDLKVGSKNLNMQVIVLEFINKYNTKDSHEIRTFKVADRTGSINMCVWDEPGTVIQPGDICRVSRSYATMYKNSLVLYIGRGGKICKVSEFCQLFSETPNMSEGRKEPPPPNADHLDGQSQMQTSA